MLTTVWPQLMNKLITQQLLVIIFNFFSLFPTQYNYFSFSISHLTQMPMFVHKHSIETLALLFIHELEKLDVSVCEERKKLNKLYHRRNDLMIL